MKYHAYCLYCREVNLPFIPQDLKQRFDKNQAFAELTRDLVTRQSHRNGIPRRARGNFTFPMWRTHCQASFLFCENESLLPSAGRGRRNAPLSLYGRKVGSWIGHGGRTRDGISLPSPPSPRPSSSWTPRRSTVG